MNTSSMPMEMNQPTTALEPRRNSAFGTDEEMEDFNLCQQLFEQGKRARANVDSTWKKQQDYYDGKQEEGLNPGGNSKPIMNVISSTIQTEVPILTDARPSFNALPKEPGDSEFAQVQSSLIESWWDQASMDHTLVEWIMDSKIYDVGIIKTRWDAEVNDGLGEIVSDVVDPADVYVPYGARDFQKECPWVLHSMRKSVGELKRKFPEKAEYIFPDTPKTEDDKNRDTSGVTLVSPTDKRTNAPVSTPVSGGDDRKTAEVWEVYIDDDSVEEVTSDAGEKELKRKYPLGKVIVCLPKQRLVLHTGDNPYDHGEKPFTRLVSGIYPRRFWGEGTAKRLMRTQKNINYILAQIFDNARMMANPVWKVEEGSGVNPEKLTNAIAQVITTKAGKIDAVKRDQPTALPQYVLELYQLLIRNSETESGVHEITQGRKPIGVTAAAAIESLQEAGQTRIRLQERNLQVSLSQLGRQVCALMIQFYHAPRVVRITGKDSIWPEYMEVMYEHDANGDIMMSKRKYNRSEDGVYTPETEWKKLPPTKGVLDIKVTAGTSLPFAKSQRTQAAFKLKDMNSIDNEELLKTLDWPNYQQVLERVKQEQEQQAAMQPPPGAM